MKLIRKLTDYKPDVPLALAIGNFDGLHQGHLAVLDRAKALASKHGLSPAVLTFEPHPRHFFAPTTPPFRLQTLRDKLAGLADAGIDRVFALKFNAAFAGMSAEDFLEQVLRAGMNVRAVITGENFSFGKARQGDTNMIRSWGTKHGILTEQLKPVIAEGDVASSTAVRAALEVGDMRHAAALLGRPYRISGRVRHGAKQGAGFGFATANIQPTALLKLPRYGIYAVRAQVQGTIYPGVASLGVRPTINPLERPLLEVHLFDFAGDLYGKRMDVQLLGFLRDEKHFDSLAALTHQMGIDAQQARDVLNG